VPFAWSGRRARAHSKPTQSSKIANVLIWGKQAKRARIAALEIMREKATRGKYIWCVVCIVVQLLVVDNTQSGGRASERLSSAPKKWVSWALFLSLSLSHFAKLLHLLYSPCRLPCIDLRWSRVHSATAEQNLVASPPTLSPKQGVYALSHPLASLMCINLAGQCSDKRCLSLARFSWRHHECKSSRHAICVFVN